MDTGLFTYIYCGDNWNITEGPDLVNEMQNGGTCAPNTDLYNYANRQILILGDTSIYNLGVNVLIVLVVVLTSSASNLTKVQITMTARYLHK